MVKKPMYIRIHVIELLDTGYYVYKETGIQFLDTGYFVQYGIGERVTGYCIRIRTRQGIYGQNNPLPEGVPEGKVRGNS